jgi:pimeloyl-ACP methyl ester carboxylesterase
MRVALREWALRGVSQEVVWLAKSRRLAVATGWAIRGEAAWRRAIGVPLTSGSAAVGLQTRGARRRLREHTEAQQLRGPVAVKSPARSSREPAVNWHESGTGPPLLLINGWTASGLAWPTAWLRRLESCFRVIRIDNRGTGWSRCAPAPFSIGDMADDARDVLLACGADRAAVLGTSMGGMVAQELALRHPGCVERLILVGTVPPTPARVESGYPYPILALHSMLVRGESLSEPTGILARSAADGFADAHPDLIDELVSQMARRATPRALALMQARAIGSWHGPGRLTRVSVPTTVVQGAEDRLVPVANGIRLSRLIRNAEYVELPGVGHLVAQEAGDELFRVVVGTRPMEEHA